MLMPTRPALRRFRVALSVTCLTALLACAASRAADDEAKDAPGANAAASSDASTSDAAPAAAGESGRTVLFNGKDLSGWKFKEQRGSEAWKVVGDVKLDPNDPKKLIGSGSGSGPSGGALLRGPIDHGSDVYTEQKFGDCELHVEFVVPKGSNSGVYLMGQYEIQVLDSYGKADDRLRQGDVGAIYSAAAPSKNASKPPGEWQAFDIVFQAPRFDAGGKKTQNAKFLSVKLNGQEIQKDVEVKGPTGGQLTNEEKPTGPLLFQGDHGIVAFRNVWVKAKGSGAAR